MKRFQNRPRCIFSAGEGPAHSIPLRFVFIGRERNGLPDEHAVVSVEAASNLLEGQHEAEAARGANVLADRQLWILALLVALHQCLGQHAKLRASCTKVTSPIQWQSWPNSGKSGVRSWQPLATWPRELKCIFETSPRTGSKKRSRPEGLESDHV